MKLTNTHNLLGVTLLTLVAASCESMSSGEYPSAYDTTGDGTSIADMTKGGTSGMTSGQSDSSSSRTGIREAGMSASGSGAAGMSAAAAAGAGMVTGSMAFPTGQAETSTLLLEKFTPGEIQSGQSFDYQVNVTNLTDLSLDNVVVVDSMSGFIIEQSDPANITTQQGEARWDLASMGPRESRVIRVRGKALEAGMITSCSSVEYDAGLCMSADVVSPSLSLTCSLSDSDLSTCEEVQATFTATNNGTGTARDIVIRGNLPTGLTTATGAGSFEKSLGDLAAGQSKEYTLAAKPSQSGSYQLNASAMGAGGLSAQSTACAANVTQPVLSIAKTGPATSFAGRKMRYEITLANTGNGVAENVVLEDMIPDGSEVRLATEGARQSGNRLSWNVGTLRPEETKTYKVELVADAFGTFTNTAVAKADCAADVMSSVDTTVKGIPAILLEVVDLEDPIAVGDNETYRIRVYNQGSADGTNVQIIATLPPNVSFISADGPTSHTTTGSSVSFEPVGAIAPKAEMFFDVIVKANSPADARFGVSMTSDQLTAGAVTETESTNYYE